MSVPQGLVWGCEECEFWTSIEDDANKHADDFRHSLALRPPPYPLEPGTKITNHGMSAWTLMPPAEGACEVCAVKHDPREPHNPESFYWHVKRNKEGKPPPTWADALAHVDEDLREAWVALLAEHGVTV